MQQQEGGARRAASKRREQKDQEKSKKATAQEFKEGLEPKASYVRQSLVSDGVFRLLVATRW
jgi:hypothetical protein